MKKTTLLSFSLFGFFILTMLNLSSNLQPSDSVARDCTPEDFVSCHKDVKLSSNFQTFNSVARDCTPEDFIAGICRKA